MNELIYLDNAATTFPKPPSVLNAMLSAAHKRGGNPGRGGHALARAADSEMHMCRKALKEFFNVPREENIVFTQNATMALNTCINGLVKTGDKVITTDCEHNSVRRPLNRINGIAVMRAKLYFDDFEKTAEEFRRLLEHGADYLVVTHASNVCGKSIDIPRICGLAHEYGAEVIVDASQSAGILDIDVAASGIDYLCAPGHKGMYGPQGTGFILINGKRIPSPLMTGGTGSNSLSAEQPDYLPDALESGTLNVPAFAGLRAGIEFLNSTGRERIHFYELSLIKRAYRELSRMKNVIMYTSEPTDADTAVLSFNIAGKQSSEAAELFDKAGICLRAGYHCAPDAHKKLGSIDFGSLRISVGVFNTAADIDRFLEAAQKISK